MPAVSITIHSSSVCSICSYYSHQRAASSASDTFWALSMRPLSVFLCDFIILGQTPRSGTSRSLSGELVTTFGIVSALGEAM